MMRDMVYDHTTDKSASILCAEPIRAQQLADIVTVCGCRLVPKDARADYILSEISSDLDRATQECAEIAAYLNRYGAEALIWIGVSQLDMAYAVLPPKDCHWLVGSDDALAVPILARANRRMDMDQLHDRSRDGDYRSLHKISDELADFARTLAQIAEQEDGTTSSMVRDKPVSFRAAPNAMLEPMVPDMATYGQTRAAQIRNLIKMRRLREQHFPADLFADPAWDILLDLYAAGLEGKKVSVSSLCIAAAVPPTTALRWITSMTEHGALVRHQDPHDARRVFIGLSDDSEQRLSRYFESAALKGGFPI